MSRSAVGLFSWLQRAPLYSQMFVEAVDLAPRGSGGLWVDFGCGPGMLPRLAAERGYRAVGVDADDAMIQRARAIDSGHAAEYLVGGLEALRGMEGQALIFSLASVLLHISEPLEFLERVRKYLAPGGEIWVIENSSELTLPHAAARMMRSPQRLRNAPFLLWAAVRGGHAFRLPPEVSARFSVRESRLTHGLASLTILRGGFEANS